LIPEAVARACLPDAARVASARPAFAQLLGAEGTAAAPTTATSPAPSPLVELAWHAAAHASLPACGHVVAASSAGRSTSGT
jgi:hypothetical protein